MTAPASRPRPARRALDDLSLPVERADVDELHLIQGLPDWSRDDRALAFDAYASLPAESNLLYTPYIDLRLAHLETARLVWDPATEHVAGDLPEDADGLLFLSEGGVVGSPSRTRLRTRESNSRHSPTCTAGSRMPRASSSMVDPDCRPTTSSPS